MARLLASLTPLTLDFHSTRHRGLVLASAVVAGVALGIRYKAEQIRKNEIAQKNSAIPNFYVSVDRSGGGI